MSTTNEPSGKIHLRALNLLHFAFIGGLTAFALVSAMLVFTNSAPVVFRLEGTLRYLVPFGFLLLIVPGLWVFKTLIAKSRLSTTLSAKLNGYRTAYIVKLAMIEGPALLAIIGFLLTGDILIFGAAACIILYFLMQKTSLNQAAHDLSLNDEERLLLDSDIPVSRTIDV